jgi:pilus assembly protein CpaE
MSHRLLLAIGDDALASSATALAAEGEELEVVDRVADPEDLTRALRRLDLDVVVLHDDLSGVGPLELAREIAAGFPDVGLVLIVEEETPELLRAAMQAGIRDVISLPLSLDQLEASARAGAMWSRALRDRVAGEDGAGGVLAGQLVAVCGAKGGVGTTTLALHLALVAAAGAPGRPVCVVDFDLQNGDFRTLLDTPYRRSVVDLVEVAGELSVRHLQETLYTHPLGIRVLFAPDDGERAEEITSEVARSVLTAVKARHALTIVDLGATVSEASAIAAEIANKMLVVTTPDVLALRGVRRLRELWRRLQVREADEDVYVVLNRASRRLEIQPDLARKVVGGRMAETTLPADFAALEAAVNTGSPARLEDGKLRGAIESLASELDLLPSAEAESQDSRGLLGRLSGERGQTVVEFTAALPILALLVVALWQIGLIGFTYVIAGHAAREGARELAVDPSEQPEDMPPYREAARDDLPGPWREHAHIVKDGDVTVKVTLRVPLVLPGVDAPWRVESQADTSVEGEPLPPRQSFTPTPTPR